MIPSLLQLDGQKVYRDRMREEGWARASETDGLFATVEVRQILELVRQFKCRVDGCKGHFKLVQASTVAHGGSVKLWFRCSGHGCVRQLIWCGSSCVTLPRRLGEAGEQVVERVGLGAAREALPLAAELELRITLEAGEAADEEAVAEKAQIKRAAKGDLTAEEAIAHAADEELELVPARTVTGYECVTRVNGRYQVRIRENGKQSHIGCFGTAEHAALHYARRF